MTDYNNGEIPLDVLMEVPGQEGDNAWGSWQFIHDWLNLKQYVYDTWGVTIWIVPGWNLYRPLAGQVKAKQDAINEGRPLDAATPGTSSHGGKYNGRMSLAADVGGYWNLKQSDWYDACRLFGFEPGFFSWEPWHIIHWNPRIGWKPEETKTEVEEVEGDDMKDLELLRWAGHVFAIGNERIYHVPNPTDLTVIQDLLGKGYRDVDNAGITQAVTIAGLDWSMLDAVLRGGAYGVNGKYWSRQIAEGEAARGVAKRASKTLEDVLATIKTLAAAKA